VYPVAASSRPIAGASGKFGTGSNRWAMSRRRTSERNQAGDRAISDHRAVAAAVAIGEAIRLTRSFASQSLPKSFFSGKQYRLQFN
jgi:hypothetical protein